MTIRDRKQLKQTAGRRVAAAGYPPRKLILIHSGLLLGLSLLITLCDYVITWQLNAHSGGLSGIQLRSVLETVPNVLSVLYNILAPFWTMGLIYAALRLARGKAAWPGALLEGFRRKGPVIRILLLQILIYGLITLAAIYAAWTLYVMLIPAGRAFSEALLQLIASGVTSSAELMEQIPEPVMERVMRGYLPFFAVCELVLLIPTLYRLRLANYMLMDETPLTPWQAIRTSGKVMRRKGFQMFLLDLSYWWYYLIPAVLTLPAYADVILEKLQISVPVDSAVLYIGGSVVYTVLTFLFQYLAKPRAVTAYALAYDALLEEYKAANPPMEQEA